LNHLATVRILVTSQSPLRMPGEQVYRLEALQLPQIGMDDIGAALGCASVSLFMSRARAANRHIELTSQNLPHVVTICRRLDGIPLALDLAAARVAQFGIEQVAARLAGSLQLLRSVGAGRPPRQQTLRAAYEWSYGLLTEGERAAFCRLGAFTGVFSLQSATRVISAGSADEWEALDRLAALVERSLVWLEPGEPPSYRLPESGRLFALEKLRAAGDTSAIELVVDEYERAGDAATARSANAEALASYSAGLAAAALLPDSPAAAALQLRLNLKLGPAVQTALSPASPRCEEIYRRSVELARRTGDERELFRAQWGHWQYLCLVGRDREAAQHATAIVAFAATLQDAGMELEARHADFTTRQLLGDAPGVVRRTAEVIALYDRAAHHRLAHEFGGHDPGVCAYGQAAVALWLTGKQARALEMAEAACALGRSLGHAYSHAVGLYYGAIAYQCSGRTADLESCARGLIDLSAQHSMEMLSTEGKLFLGRARFEKGETASGIAEMRSALAAILATGEYGFAMFYSVLLAEALIATGATGDAYDVLQRARQFAEHGQGFFLPEVHRLLGELLVLNGDPSGALAHWQTAETISVEQGAISLLHRLADTRERLRRT
jgi:predicted ATPase